MSSRRRPRSRSSSAASVRDGPTEPRPPMIINREPPQEKIEQFWNKFHSRRSGKAVKVLPKSPQARIGTAELPKGAVQGQTASTDYEQARDRCIRDVNRIVKECRRVNQKFSDADFDIEFDLKSGRRYCLDGLCDSAQGVSPQGVKRVPEIFEKPQFFDNGIPASDVRQGRGGDCWLMAALASLASKESFIQRVCPARDEKVGVYGFVFQRDGEWQQCIIDDKLYLISPDFEESPYVTRFTEEEWLKYYQSGSRSLYFAACGNENETWVPLLEKAYAKAHGDYLSIRGGWTCEAVEDLTGGVTSEILANNVLDRDLLWREELLMVNTEFLFSASTGHFANWLVPIRPPVDQRKGIQESHAYSILEAREIDGLRLLKLRNPWGKVEWTGAWSDGSKEWTLEWMTKLNHRFGNDGVFWITYDDLLKKYTHFDRTRLFDDSWKITQQWTSLNVPWSGEYHSTKFSVTVTAAETPVVIVLSQLDKRYFFGLEGEYSFRLEFRVEKQSTDADEGDNYIVSSHGHAFVNRSVSTDIALERGTYDVFVKVVASRNPDSKPTDEVVECMAEHKQEKLIQIGKSYDLAHAKGRAVEPRAEREKKKKKKKKEQGAQTKLQAQNRAKLREQLKEQKRKSWIKAKKDHARMNRATNKQQRIRALRGAKWAEEERRMNGSWGIVRNSDREFDGGSPGADQPQSHEKTAQDIGNESGDKDVDQDKVADPQLSQTDSGAVVIADSSPVISDAASFCSFEFDSDLDMPSENETDFEPQLQPRPRRTPRSQLPPPFPLPFRPPPPPPPFPLPYRPPPRNAGHYRNNYNDNNSNASNDEDGNGDRPNISDDDRAPTRGRVVVQHVLNSWNAVCVVSLRVYSKDEGLSVAVVTPSDAAAAPPSPPLNGETEQNKGDGDDANDGTRGGNGEGEGEGEGVMIDSEEVKVDAEGATTELKEVKAEE